MRGSHGGGRKRIPPCRAIRFQCPCRVVATMLNTPRALLVTPTSPWACSFGAQQRTALLYEALAELLPVDVLLLEEGDENEVTAGERPEILARISWNQPALTVYKYATNPWANAWCHAHIDWTQFVLVVSRYITPMTKIDWPRHMRTIADCDDASYRYIPGTDTIAARAMASLRGQLRVRQTRAVIKRYDHAFFCSPRDAALFRSRSSSILPNVVRISPEPPAAPQVATGNVLILGSMWYPPNRQGVDWYIEHCWPAIAARCPGLILRIVGPAPVEDRRRWARVPRTEVPGFMEDLYAEYARALFAVAPIHYGGGTCIKFLESAAFRKPCVVSRYVFEGFNADFRDGYSVLVAGDAQQMVEKCAALFESAERRSAIAERAFDTVARLYTVERFKTTVQAAVRHLTSLGEHEDKLNGKDENQ
jgi:Glycosyl transferases group 1